jgi:hypothetical protein
MSQRQKEKSGRTGEVSWCRRVLIKLTLEKSELKAFMQSSKAPQVSKNQLQASR